jgi:hypothetical protein
VGHTLCVGVLLPSIHASEGPFLVHVVGDLGTVRIVQKLGTLRHLFGSCSTLIPSMVFGWVSAVSWLRGLGEST